MEIHNLEEGRLSKELKRDVLILTDDDYYDTGHGPVIKGGSAILYKYKLIVHLKRDGNYRIVKDFVGLPPWEMKDIVSTYQKREQQEPDNRLLLNLLP